MQASYDPKTDTLSFVLKEGVAVASRRVTDAKKMEFQVAWCERHVT